MGLVSLDVMLPGDRARAARMALENPVLMHLVDKEMSDATEALIGAETERDFLRNKYILLSYRDLIAKLKKETFHAG